DPTGRRLASCDSNGCVFVWDAAAQEVSVHNWRTGTRNAVSADGRCLADGSIKVPLRVCDATTGAEIAQRIPLTEDGQLYLSPSGDQVAVPSSRGTSVGVWDVKTGRHVNLPLPKG